MEDPIKRPEKIKLTEINPYLTCYLCKGYLIDATTISECLHSFCRSCIIKFLQDNSYCPVCEVIINKAKPNLKLDKTLQDIVYKLVPELFVREMTRRKQYYKQYPQIAVRVSPEERGEDTERTIFNPKDCISLSMEYISSDSSPGAIKLLVSKNGSDKNELSLEENQALMKRYLQCPGMCRVDVLKKFVRNKYNVDTSLFHIDILYKRVPLPDHYTLIDIAYIYSWKRNEPMKFFFRITDITKLSERFDYFDSKKPNELIVQLPLRNSRTNGTSRRKEHVMNKKKNKQDTQIQAKDCDKPKSEIIEKVINKPECDKVEQKQNNKENVKVEETTKSDSVTPKRFILKIKKDPEKDNLKIEDAFKNSVTSDSPDQKPNPQSVYTSITLNRTNNMEIITKIHKVSNKEGQPIALNIVEQTFKGNETKENNTSDTKNEQIKFLENFQLVSKDSAPSTERKRKASPAKSGSPKKPKLDKKVTRIILQSKPQSGLQSLIENCKIPSSLSITLKDENNKISTLIPPVKNYIEILKLPDEKPTVDKLNLRMNDDSEQKVDQDLAEIAKSLTEKIPMSTTISQIVGPKPEFPIPIKTNVPTKFNIQPSPVPEITNKLLNVPKENKLKPRSPQSFQKIFEESIKKPDEASDSSNEVTSTSNNKRNILEIASQLYKKTKQELEKNQIDSTTPKVAIPRLPHQRNLKATPKQTLTNLHSNALGLNYTISVGPNSNGIITKKDGEDLPRNISPGVCNSPKISPKSSPIIKHMYAPMPNLLMEQLRVNTSPKINNLSKKSPNLPSSSTSSNSPKPSSISPKPSSSSPKYSGMSPKPSGMSPKPSNMSSKPSGMSKPSGISPKPSGISSKPPSISSKPPGISSKPPGLSSKPSSVSPLSVVVPSKPSSSNQVSPLSPNQILERYNIQNLAQLTASLNFNAGNFGLGSGNQLAAFQHAMLLKHFEIQNRQNWLNMNQGSLVQYEKYLQNLQNLKTAQSHLLGNNNS